MQQALPLNCRGIAASDHFKAAVLYPAACQQGAHKQLDSMPVATLPVRIQKSPV